MSNSNQENIEARLATYVDGELEPADQVELEAHLEQNPQYRRLVEDLRQAREMLRTLPREKAPAELAEAFTSQLERSILLDPGTEAREPRLQIRAWPRVFAAAAIFIMTLGLGTIVYFVLPDRGRTVATTGSPVSHPLAPTTRPTGEVHDTNSNPRDTTLAQAPPDKGPGSNNPDETLADNRRKAGTPVPTFAKREKLEEEASVEKLKAGAGNESRAEAGRADLNATLAEARRTEVEQLARNISRQREIVQWVSAAQNEKDDAAKSAANHAIVMVIRANEPREVEKTLDEFCAPNNIELQTASEQTANALNTSLSQRNQNREMATSLAAGAPAANAKPLSPPPLDQVKNKKSEIADSNAGQQQRQYDGQPQAAAPIKPGAPAGGRGGGYGSKAAEQSKGQPAAPAAALAPTPAPTASVALQDKAQRSDELKQAAKSDVAASIEVMYVARHLSRNQAAELTSRLGRNGAVAQADIPTATDEAANMALRSGENTTDNLGAARAAIAQGADGNGDGSRRQNAAFGGHAGIPAATQQSDVIVKTGDQLNFRYRFTDKDTKERSETVVVKEDGTIEPPGLGGGSSRQLQVAGKTVDEVQKLAESSQDPQKAAEPGTPGSVKVSIVKKDSDSSRLLSDGRKPTTSPAALDALADGAERRNAIGADAPVAQTNPAPATDTVDVVIVVQKEVAPANNPEAPAVAPSATPAPPPATQPSTSPPSDPEK